MIKENTKNNLKRQDEQGKKCFLFFIFMQEIIITMAFQFLSDFLEIIEYFCTFLDSAKKC